MTTPTDLNTERDTAPTLRAALVALIYETTRRDPAAAARELADDTPCVGGDLLQDSLDVLEFIVSLDRVYGVSIRDADAGKDALTTLAKLQAYVAANCTR